MKVLFGTVVYPDASKYMDDFFDSLDRQTYKDFRLLIISDGVAISDIKDIISKYNIAVEIVVADEGMTPAALRMQLLLEAKIKAADVIVLGDIDDTFSENRVEKVVETFNANPEAGFVYNDLLLPDKTVIMPPLPAKTYDIEDILEYNYLGLSTTAICISKLTEDFIKSLGDCKSFVFDWYLYCRLLLFGLNGVKATNAETYYRIYDNNFAGVPTNIPENIEKELNVKKNHFDALSKYDDRYKRLLDSYNNGKYQFLKQDRYFWWNLTKEED